jgi:hypothetical protein
VIDALQRIAAPALVLVGEHDAAYLRSAEVLAAKLPIEGSDRKDLGSRRGLFGLVFGLWSLAFGFWSLVLQSVISSDIS